MLETLIFSKTRIKLLLRLFLNLNSTAYLRGLSDEFGESTNAIRIELNRFEQANMLTSENKGNKKIYKANLYHPLFKEIHNLLLKHTGIYQLIEQVISHMKQVEQVYLAGDYALGKDLGIIDLVVIGDLNKNSLISLGAKAEKLTSRKVRFLTYEKKEWEKLHQLRPEVEKYLLPWKVDAVKSV